MDLWVFDNDGTLYDDKLAQDAFMNHLVVYCGNRLGIPHQHVHEEARRLRIKYGTSSTVIAITQEFNLDIKEVIEQTYLRIDLSACQLPVEDPYRNKALASIKARKVVFTSNPSVFARRILERIGLLGHFDDVIGMEETSFILKPNLEAFLALMRRYPNATRIFFCDDLKENLDVAATLGWKTLWYLPDGEGSQSSHMILRSFESLPNIQGILLGEA